MNGNTRGLSSLLALCCSTVISTAHVCLTSDQLSCDFSRTMDNGCQKVVRITMATVAREHQTTLVGITCNELFCMESSGLTSSCCYTVPCDFLLTALLSLFVILAMTCWSKPVVNSDAICTHKS